MKKLFYFSLFFLVFGFNSFSQNLEISEEKWNSFNPQKLEALNNSGLFLLFPNSPDMNRSNTNSQVFIEQIGDGNKFYSFTFSEQSDLRVFQDGNENIISVLANTKKLDGEIIQHGNNNYSFNFAHDPNRDLNITLLQEGDNHHFERHGSNSIGNDLQFRMTGESQTIIVRNFQ